MILLGIWALGFLFAMGIMISESQGLLGHRLSRGEWVFATLLMLISWPLWLGVWLGGSR